MLTPLFVLVFALLAAERALEIAIDRRNRGRLAARGAVRVVRDGFVPILAAQVALFAGTAAEVAFAPWSGEHAATWAIVGVLVAAQALRYWCITTLGERWSVRVLTLPGVERVARGPYRYFPHPNYVAVLAEAIALPLAFGAFATLAIVPALQLAALWNRIRIEERALARADPKGHAGRSA